MRNLSLVIVIAGAGLVLPAFDYHKAFGRSCRSSSGGNSPCKRINVYSGNYFFTYPKPRRRKGNITAVCYYDRIGRGLKLHAITCYPRGKSPQQWIGKFRNGYIRPGGAHFSVCKVSKTMLFCDWKSRVGHHIHFEGPSTR